MSTFQTYEVRDEQSGRLFFSGSLADCNTQATALALVYKLRTMNIVPVGYSNGSDRPLLDPGPQAAVSNYT